MNKLLKCAKKVLDRYDGDGVISYLQDSDIMEPLREALADTSPINVEKYNCDANATLIAAAPDLLAALKDVLKNLRQPTGDMSGTDAEPHVPFEWYANALSAIKKAEK